MRGGRHDRRKTWGWTAHCWTKPLRSSQTSDWEGTLWGKPDWADRPSDNPAEWLTRARHEPGTVYKYNDVRVNALALAALEVWRRPLPKVLKEYVMDPIGSSNTWRWHGYENSWVTIDGLKMQSVSGGGHWGGGMWIYRPAIKLDSATLRESWLRSHPRRRTWKSLAAVAPFLLIPLSVYPFFWRALNALSPRRSGSLSFGSRYAADERRARLSQRGDGGRDRCDCGIIGFVGLVIPHIVRICIGPDHRFLIPGSALLGAVLLLGTDLISRLAMAPGELPIGIVTALLGAPFFLGLVYYSRARIWS